MIDIIGYCIIQPLETLDLGKALSPFYIPIGIYINSKGGFQLDCHFLLYLSKNMSRCYGLYKGGITLIGRVTTCSKNKPVDRSSKIPEYLSLSNKINELNNEISYLKEKQRKLIHR